MRLTFFFLIAKKSRILIAINCSDCNSKIHSITGPKKIKIMKRSTKFLAFSVLTVVLSAEEKKQKNPLKFTIIFVNWPLNKLNLIFFIHSIFWSHSFWFGKRWFNFDDSWKIWKLFVAVNCGHHPALIFFLYAFSLPFDSTSVERRATE